MNFSKYHINPKHSGKEYMHEIQPTLIKIKTSIHFNASSNKKLNYKQAANVCSNLLLNVNNECIRNLFDKI